MSVDKGMRKPAYEETSYRLLFPSCFWPFKCEIPISEIKEVKIIEHIPWYIGWGLRVWFGRKLYFAIHHSKSVEIEKKRGYWRKIILSVKNPEKFIRIVERLRR